MQDQQATLNDGSILHIRLDETPDIQFLEEISRAAYGKELIWQAEDFYWDAYERYNTYYLIAEQNGRDIGFLGARVDHDDVHISNFVVFPQFQSLGVGHHLLEALKKNLHQVKREGISLEVRQNNIRAQRFYEREGFRLKEIRRNYYRREHENALILVWGKRIERKQ